jgi:hypothetical protein
MSLLVQLAVVREGRYLLAKKNRRDNVTAVFMG